MPIRGDRLRWPPRPGKRANATRDGGAPRSVGTRQTNATDESSPAPRQPHEHDESADSQAGEPSDVMQRAHDDVTAGRMDTDCRNEAVDIVERNQRKPRRNP